MLKTNHRWVSPSPVNNSAWHAIIVSHSGPWSDAAHWAIQDAEIASLTEDPNAFKLYDNAIKSVNLLIRKHNTLTGH